MMEASSILVTAIRLFVVVAPHVSHGRRLFLPTTNFIYSPLLQSIFVRPHQNLVHVQEANAINKLLSGRFVDAYQAHQAIRLPPLVLATALTLLPLEHKERQEDDSSAGSNGFSLSSELWVGLFLLAVDLLIGYYLQAVGKELLLPRKPDTHIVEEERLQLILPSAIQPPNGNIFPLTREPQVNDVQPLFPMTELPTLAAKVYYWSPVTVLASGTYHCFQNVPFLLLLVAVHEACKRQRKSLSLAAFSLALAAYWEPHYCVFLVPLAIWAFQQSPKNKQGARQQLEVVLFFVFWSIVLQGLSYTLVGPTHYRNVLKATYGTLWKNMGPNLSLLWYFQIQLFSRFRDYFATIITGLPYILIAPLTARLHKYPMALLAILWFIWTIFRPDQSLYDLNVGLCFFLFSPHSLARINLPVFSIVLCSLWVPVILNVLDSWMWLETSSGNANYIYFQCLGYNAFLGILVGQFCSATLQRDKALRMTAKSIEKGNDPNLKK